MLAIICCAMLSATPEQEAATKSYWIGLNDVIHGFNKSVNSKPSEAPKEIKKAIAKIRSMSTKNVDSLVIMYSERRMKLAMDYADFLEKTKFGSEEVFFRADYSIKEHRKKLDGMQEKFQTLVERHWNMDAEQEVVVAYLREKYGLDIK